MKVHFTNLFIYFSNYFTHTHTK